METNLSVTHLTDNQQIIQVLKTGISLCIWFSCFWSGFNDWSRLAINYAHIIISEHLSELVVASKPSALELLCFCQETGRWPCPVNNAWAPLIIQYFRTDLGGMGPQSTEQQLMKMFLWLYGFVTSSPLFPDQEPLIWKMYRYTLVRTHFTIWEEIQPRYNEV